MAAIGQVPSALPTKQHLISTACSDVLITDVLCTAIAHLTAVGFRAIEHRTSPCLRGLWGRPQIYSI